MSGPVTAGQPRVWGHSVVIHSGGGRILSIGTLDQIHMHLDQCKHIYRNYSYSDGRGELFHVILKAQGGSKVTKNK